MALTLATLSLVLLQGLGQWLYAPRWDLVGQFLAFIGTILVGAMTNRSFRGVRGVLRDRPNDIRARLEQHCHRTRANWVFTFIADVAWLLITAGFADQFLWGFSEWLCTR